MSLFGLTEEFEQALAKWDGRAARPSRTLRDRRIRAYASGFVEYFLAGTHPLLPLAYFGWTAVWAARCIVSAQSPWEPLLLFGSGAVTFSLAEYLTHRFAFHRSTEEPGEARRRAFLVHGLHHEQPSDRWRLMVPPMLSFPLGLVFYTAYASIWGPSEALIPFGGTCLAYLGYDWTHYSIHTNRRARTPWGRVSRRLHMIHHYSDGTWNFGVTTPLWDLVFGTFAWSSRDRAMGNDTLRGPHDDLEGDECGGRTPKSGARYVDVAAVGGAAFGGEGVEDHLVDDAAASVRAGDAVAGTVRLEREDTAGGELAERCGELFFGVDGDVREHSVVTAGGAGGAIAGEGQRLFVDFEDVGTRLGQVDDLRAVCVEGPKQELVAHMGGERDVAEDVEHGVFLGERGDAVVSPILDGRLGLAAAAASVRAAAGGEGEADGGQGEAASA